jgi:hypothetical protein
MDKDDGRAGAILFKIESNVVIGGFHRFLPMDMALRQPTAKDIPRFYSFRYDFMFN